MLLNLLYSSVICATYSRSAAVLGLSIIVCVKAWITSCKIVSSLPAFFFGLSRITIRPVSSSVAYHPPYSSLPTKSSQTFWSSIKSTLFAMYGNFFKINWRTFFESLLNGVRCNISLNPSPTSPLLTFFLSCDKEASSFWFARLSFICFCFIIFWSSSFCLSHTRFSFSFKDSRSFLLFSKNVFAFSRSAGNFSIALKGSVLLLYSISPTNLYCISLVNKPAFSLWTFCAIYWSPPTFPIRTVVPGSAFLTVSVFALTRDTLVSLSSTLFPSITQVGFNSPSLLVIVFAFVVSMSFTLFSINFCWLGIECSRASISLSMLLCCAIKARWDRLSFSTSESVFAFSNKRGLPLRIAVIELAAKSSPSSSNAYLSSLSAPDFTWFINFCFVEISWYL